MSIYQLKHYVDLLKWFQLLAHFVNIEPCKGQLRREKGEDFEGETANICRKLLKPILISQTLEGAPRSGQMQEWGRGGRVRFGQDYSSKPQQVMKF